MYTVDKRIVMTLDAGGTNFVFSAIQSNAEIVVPVILPSNASDLNRCLHTLVEGFTQVKNQLSVPPVAISFAFPGPADYTNGIIGDLPNLKAFRGGVALGPFLSDKFEIPVFINNDGNLFAFGEAIAGILPEVNRMLVDAGSPKRYKNLLALTLGTGFGAGVVIDGKLLTGDNGAGGDVWVFRHKKLSNCITEESVGAEAIRRMYAQFSGQSNDGLTPLDIYRIAKGFQAGDQPAALKCFAELGEEVGNVIAHAITLIDGLVVIGGGLTGAADLFMPALLSELRTSIGKLNGEQFPRLQMKPFNLDNPTDLRDFLTNTSVSVNIPGTTNQVLYNSEKKTAIAISKQGASKAIALGAYAFALNAIDSAAKNTNQNNVDHEQ